MTEKPVPIPEALLALLQEAWKPDNGMFHIAWDHGERSRNPSFYFLRGEEPAEMQTLSRPEAAALLEAGVLDGLCAETHGGEALRVNEHAVHAISDFCGEVYVAWAKLQRRLERAREAAPLPN